MNAWSSNDGNAMLLQYRKRVSPMIVKTGPTDVKLSFEDWTSDMMALSTKLHRLPKSEDRLVSHEVGIDWLNSLPGGPEAVIALFDLADDLKTCPDCHQVLWLGKAIIKANTELNDLRQERETEMLIRRREDEGYLRWKAKQASFYQQSRYANTGVKIEWTDHFVRDSNVLF
jgi:hypothetical protein